MRSVWSRLALGGGSLKAKQREMKRARKVQLAVREKGTMHERNRMTDQRKRDDKPTEERTQLKGYANVQGCERQAQGQCECSERETKHEAIRMKEKWSRDY